MLVVSGMRMRMRDPHAGTHRRALPRSAVGADTKLHTQYPNTHWWNFQWKCTLLLKGTTTLSINHKKNSSSPSPPANIFPQSRKRDSREC